MSEWLTPYAATVFAIGATGGLLLIQILIADFAGIRVRHEPGTPIAADHGNFLFRASRAHANTNESIAVFLLLALFGIFAAAPAGWLGALAWGYVAGRAGHMLCYYLDLRLARSLSFAVSLLALVGMLGVGVAAAVR